MNMSVFMILGHECVYICVMGMFMIFGFEDLVCNINVFIYDLWHHR